MEILLLGNGFDLHYYLPTKYNNFLHTVEYLAHINLIFPKTAGEVFSNARLTKKDSFIAKCYEVNKGAFDSVILNHERISKLTKLAHDNMWCRYLLSSYNTDVGWIDFEREIKNVLFQFKTVLEIKNPCPDFNLMNNQVLVHMLKSFSAFTKSEEGSSIYSFRQEYLLEEPFGSKNFKVNIDKIVEELFEDLCNLAEMLKIYLSEFVEKAICNIPKNDLNEWVKAYSPKYIISFNYTDTYEKLFSNESVIHIHGTNDTRIVLGINPDNDDEETSTDTTFLQFKKYYQRVFYQTDSNYLAALESLEEAVEGREDTCLTVIGHSLDETDKDIIKELFGRATYINVLYHNSSDLSKHMKNLVNIYGKRGFDELRYKKELTFIQLSIEIENVKNFDGVLGKVLKKTIEG